MVVIELFVLAAAIGLLLGLRYKVFVLAPAALFASVSLLSATQGAGSATILLLSALMISALQVGYFFGGYAQHHFTWQIQGASDKTA